MRVLRHFNWSIKKRLLIIVSLLIFVSVSLVTALTYITYEQDLTALSTAQTGQLLEQLAINTDTYLEELFRLCLSPYYSNRVMQQLEASPKTAQEKLSKQRVVEDYLGEVMTIPRSDILRAYILTDAIYASSKTQYAADILPHFTQESWYQDALLSTTPIFLPVRAESGRTGGPQYVFSIVQQLRSTRNSSQVLGVIRVDANYSGIKAVCDRAAVLPGSSLLILDSNGNQIYQNLSLKKDFPLDALRQSLAQYKESSFSLHGDRDTYIVQVQPLVSTDWQIISVRSRRELMQPAVAARNRAMVMALLCAFVGVLIATPLIRRFLKPIYAITGLMKKVEQGNLSVRFESAGKDELHYLGHSFNDMLSQIEDALARDTLLTRQIYEAKYLEKQAQYVALYNQIRPHFLFNALNTVKLLIKSGRTEDAAASVDQLSTLLRGLVHTGQQTTLSAECKIVQSYLLLQQMRHDSLTYSLDIPSALNEYPLPSILLQPLVENALIHGCEPKRGPTHIHVFATFENDALFLHVEDNGVGMTQPQLAQLQGKLLEQGDDPLSDEYPSSVQIGVGLVNICRRVRLKYGPAYGLTIDSTLDKGTHAILHLPATGQEEEYV